MSHKTFETALVFWGLLVGGTQWDIGYLLHHKLDMHTDNSYAEIMSTKLTLDLLGHASHCHC